MIKLNVVILWIVFFSSSLLFSQNENEDLHFSLSVINNFNQNEFHKFWKPGIGIGTGLSFDYLKGELGFGLGLMRFEKKVESTKNFYGVDYYFLYRYLPELFDKLNLIVGFDAGIFEFIFDDDDDLQSSAEKVEREFAIKIITGFAYNISDSWRTELKTSYHHIYTKRKIELFYINLSLVKLFSAPEWIKEFLK